MKEKGVNAYSSSSSSSQIEKQDWKWHSSHTVGSNGFYADISNQHQMQ